MPEQSLERIPDRADVFIDANIFIYGLGGASSQCKTLLERCSREEITGICLLETVNEATHRLMIAEAKSKGLISDAAKELRTKPAVIQSLSEYWAQTEQILSLNLLFLALEQSTLGRAHPVRKVSGLMTNDSMIIACMREYGVSALASNDSDFSRISGIQLYRPSDVINH